MTVSINNPSYGCAIQVGVNIGDTYRSLNGTFQDASGVSFTVGSSAGQVNKEYVATLTIATGTPLLLDLTALVNEAAATFALSTIETIKISNKSAAIGENITIGGGTNGLFTALPFPLVATSRGDSSLLVATPITIDSTHKILQLAAAAGTAVTVLLSILGR